MLGIKARFEEEVVLEYEQLQVPVSSELRGCIVDYMCGIQQRVAESAPVQDSPADKSSGHIGTASVSNADAAGAGDVADEVSTSGSVGSRVTSVDRLPLMNEQVPMEDRAVISEPLFTGIKVRLLRQVQAMSKEPQNVRTAATCSPKVQITNHSACEVL